MDQQHASLETLQDIRRIMDRSSRFISLSGLSGVSAGVFALIGVYLAQRWIGHSRYVTLGADIEGLKWKLLLLAAVILSLALVTAFYFTWRRARRNNVPIWDHSSRKLFINMMIPLTAGGIFVLGLWYHSAWAFIAPATLVFYGVALVSASKYTLSDIRYLGLLEIALGLVCMWLPGWGLYCWAVGFGLLHIVYGLIMWWKYETPAGGREA